MQDTVICLKATGELLSESFFIPDYQRGYRWSELQVTELLEDVMGFQASKEGSHKDGFYCLQPIVLKRRPDAEEWEVVDGQQRLTTLFLIFRYFNQRLVEKHQKPLFRLRYQTRPRSEEYLKTLDGEQSDENIDYHFMFNAARTIEEWFDDKQNMVADFEGALENRVKVIWYELPEAENPINAFTRLNVGKIPLTDAELVRALFLRGRNFPQVTATLQQLKIAQEWDTMEKSLQRDAFWYFLTDHRDRPNRVELLFDLITQAAEGAAAPGDSLSSFHYFNELLSQEEVTPDQLWNKVKDQFMTLEEWYEDQELFHLAGYLVGEGETVLSLLSLAEEGGRREFRAALKQQIWARLIDSEDDLANSSDAQVREAVSDHVEGLRYGPHSPVIRSTLLLFNIASIVENKRSIVRFRFDYYKKESWDIEHIRSVASECPTANAQKRSWLEVVCEYFDSTEAEVEHSGEPVPEEDEEESLTLRAQEMIDSKGYTNQEGFRQLFEEILERFGEDQPNETENGIGNLALLDSSTNRAYKNAAFPVKRHRLLELDRAGTFVPLCTRNAFLKCYSSNLEEMLAWRTRDQTDYRRAITKTLVGFFTANEDG